MNDKPVLTKEQSDKQHWRTRQEAYYVWADPKYREFLIKKHPQYQENTADNNYKLAMEVMRTRKELVITDDEAASPQPKTQKAKPVVPVTAASPNAGEEFLSNVEKAQIRKINDEMHQSSLARQQKQEKVPSGALKAAQSIGDGSLTNAKVVRLVRKSDVQALDTQPAKVDEPTRKPSDRRLKVSPLVGTIDSIKGHVEVKRLVRRDVPPPSIPEKTDVRKEIWKGPIEWKELNRTSEVNFVGDLHGSQKGFKENSKTLGFARENNEGRLEWAGGNRRVVYLGDILGDRQTGSLEILLNIEEIKKQAAKEGGSVEVIAGNHDDFETSFLMGRPSADGGNAIENMAIGNQGLGVMELRKFGSRELQDMVFAASPGETWKRLQEERQIILEHMRTDSEGKKILEAICSMKLISRLDDTLILHTNPTIDIVRNLKGYLVEEKLDIDAIIQTINANYQGNLRKILLKGEEPDKYFEGIRTLFLHTNNRDDFDLNYNPAGGDANKEIEELMKTLRENGINLIVHGHTDEAKWSAKPFPIISADKSAFKNDRMSDVRSIVKIRQNGIVEKGESNIVLRE